MVYNTSHMSQFDARVIEFVLFYSMAENFWKVVLGFPQTSPRVHLPFANFALYISAVINLSCEYKYLLNPVSSSELLNLGEVLATPNTGRYMFSSALQNI